MNQNPGLKIMTARVNHLLYKEPLGDGPVDQTEVNYKPEKIFALIAGVVLVYAIAIAFIVWGPL